MGVLTTANMKNLVGVVRGQGVEEEWLEAESEAEPLAPSHGVAIQLDNLSNDT